MSEFRWLLLAAGILILLVIFWWSRREASGRPLIPPSVSRRRLPGLGWGGDRQLTRTGSGERIDSGEVSPGGHDRSSAEHVVTVRLTGHGSATFAGETLVLALREAGLLHGRFGIFHRHDPKLETRVLFSVASLVEPGSFDLTRVKTERYPGVSLFLALPGAGDGAAAFDDMMMTARKLAATLDGELLDEHGSHLSVQRERYLREEIIRFQHKLAPP